MTNQHKPLTAAEKIIRRGLAASPRHDFPQEFGEMTSALTSCNLHDKGDIAQVMAYMLSLLTPPTDAELREAVLSLAADIQHLDDSDDTAKVDAEAVRTLLRAVRGPRLTGHTDDLAVDDFAVAMKAKLAQKRAEGRSGWDDPDECHVDFLVSLLHGHIQKGDPVDVANISMMLWSRGLRGNGSVPAPRLTGDAEKMRYWLGVIAQNISDRRHPHAGLDSKERWSCPCFECVVWRCLQECAAFPGVFGKEG